VNFLTYWYLITYGTSVAWLTLIEAKNFKYYIFTYLITHLLNIVSINPALLEKNLKKNMKQQREARATAHSCCIPFNS